MSASDLSLLSLREGNQAQQQEQQQTQQQPQQRVLDFIIVEDEEGGERQQTRRWGWSNADADGEGGGDGRSPALSSSSTGKAKAGKAVLLSSPPPPRPVAAAGGGARVTRRFRYTDATLQSALFTAGVKPRLAKKISKAVFAQLTASTPPLPSTSPLSAAASAEGTEKEDKGPPPPPPLSSATLPRSAFASLVAAASDALSKPEKRPLSLSPTSVETACGLVERRTPVALLLAGTSGSGKTTLAGLLAARLGGASVVSTDSVRHALASSLPEHSREARLLRASTYEAGDLLVEWEKERESSGGGQKKSGACSAAAVPPPPQPSSFLLDRAAVVRGYEAQAALVQPAVERIVAAAAARGESVVVEGAHVGIPFAVALAAAGCSNLGNPQSSDSEPFLLHPCACPFLVHISNEQKHAERFAVRAKAMVAINDAAGSGNRKEGGKKGSKKESSNSYVAALPRIRAIQSHLRSLALAFAVPCVDNTSVDRSVEAVARAVLGCARRVAAGGRLVGREEAAAPGGGGDAISSSSLPSSSSSATTVLTCRPVAAEFAAATAALWSSKAALGLIRQKREQRGEFVGFLSSSRGQQQLEQQQQPWWRAKGGGRENNNDANNNAPSSSSAPSTSAASSPPRALSELDAFAAAELMMSRRRRSGSGRRRNNGGKSRNGGGGSSSDGGGEHSPSASDSPSGSEGERGGVKGSLSSPPLSPLPTPAEGGERADSLRAAAPEKARSPPPRALPLPLARPAARALLAAAAAADDGGVSVTEGEDEDDDDEEDEEEERAAELRG